MNYEDKYKNDEDIDLEDSLDEIYDDISLRINKNVWSALFENEVFWDMDESSDAEETLFNFLCCSHYLPADIWKFIDETFRWSTNELDLLKKYHKDDVDLILKCIKNPNPINYDYLSNISSDELDNYLALKEKIINTKDYKENEKYIDEAFKICDTDPEVMKLKGINLIEQDKQQEALAYFYMGEKINDKDSDLCYRIGCLLQYFDRLDEAVEYLNKALDLNYEYKDSLYYMMAVCNYKMDNMYSAKKYFLKSILVYGLSCEKFLKNIEKLLSGRSKKKIKFKHITSAQMHKKQRKKDRFKDKFYKIIGHLPKPIAYLLLIIFMLFIFMIYGIVTLIAKPFVRRKKIKTYEDLKNSSNKKNIGITLKNIQATGYYKLKDNRILAEDQLDKQNLWLEVTNGIYYGTIDDKKVLFSDCKISAYHKDDFELKGKAHAVSEEIYKEIIDKFDIDEDKLIIGR